MHYVIMGCGRVGAELTIQLAKAGHSVSIIDKRSKAFERLPPGFEARKIVGVGFDRAILEEAGIEKADAFIAVYDPRRAEIYERLDIPTVATVRWAAKQIQYLLFHGKEQLRDTLAGGSLLQLQVAVPEHLVGKKIAGVESEGQVEVIGVERGGTGFIPKPDSTFQNGDVAHFVVQKDAVDKFDTLMEPVAE